MNSKYKFTQGDIFGNTKYTTYSFHVFKPK